MVDLVYKFNEKSTTSVSKGKLTAKCQYNFLGCHIHMYMDISPDHITPACACACRVKST